MQRCNSIGQPLHSLSGSVACECRTSKWQSMLTTSFHKGLSILIHIAK